MRKLLRWLAAKLFGPPVCPACSVYQINCIGTCGLSAEERERAYIGRDAQLDRNPRRE